MKRTHNDHQWTQMHRENFARLRQVERCHTRQSKEGGGTFSGLPPKIFEKVVHKKYGWLQPAWHPLFASFVYFCKILISALIRLLPFVCWFVSFCLHLFAMILSRRSLRLFLL